MKKYIETGLGFRVRERRGEEKKRGEEKRRVEEENQEEEKKRITLLFITSN